MRNIDAALWAWEVALDAREQSRLLVDLARERSEDEDIDEQEDEDELDADNEG